MKTLVIVLIILAVVLVVLMYLALCRNNHLMDEYGAELLEKKFGNEPDKNNEDDDTDEEHKESGITPEMATYAYNVLRQYGADTKCVHCVLNHACHEHFIECPKLWEDIKDEIPQHNS